MSTTVTSLCTPEILAIWGLGPLELTIILVIVLLIFGAGKLPKIGKQVGEAISSFKKAKEGIEDHSTSTAETRSADAKKEEVEIEPV